MTNAEERPNPAKLSLWNKLTNWLNVQSEDTKEYKTFSEMDERTLKERFEEAIETPPTDAFSYGVLPYKASVGGEDGTS